MTIKHTKHAQGSTAAMLTECPVDGCDKTFDGNGGERRAHYLNDHDPEDLGL